MDIGKLKYVVGEAKKEKPAYIRFYGEVSQENTNRFNEEFSWLSDVVKPSKIVIGINSEGGSVLHGMGTFSLIQNSQVETETIIEGLAASMGSILWAAGTRSYMRDYSLLMIHNPFLKHATDELTPDQQQIVDAFRTQVETVYQRRFGLSKAKVKEIMDGKEGCDGTFMTAKQAVEAGIIPAENVIKTPKQIRDKVLNKIEGVTEISALKEIMLSANEEMSDFKPLSEAPSIHNQTDIKKDTMNEKELNSICAQLGLKEGSDMLSVVNRLTALQNAEKDLKELRNSFDELKIQKEGCDAQLANVNNELTKAKAELKTYHDAETAKRNAEIEAMVDAAITAGKISAESKDKWVAMAQTNLEMVKATLDSIQSRDKISEEIANDKKNVEEAEDQRTDAEKVLAAQVEEAVGKNFKYRTLED